MYNIKIKVAYKLIKAQLSKQSDSRGSGRQLGCSPICLNWSPLLSLQKWLFGGWWRPWFFFRKGCYAQTLLAHLWRETLIPVLLDLYNKLMGTAGSRRCDLCYAAPAVLCGDLMACRTGSNS